MKFKLVCAKIVRLPKKFTLNWTWSRLNLAYSNSSIVSLSLMNDLMQATLHRRALPRACHTTLTRFSGGKPSRSQCAVSLRPGGHYVCLPTTRVRVTWSLAVEVPLPHECVPSCNSMGINRWFENLMAKSDKCFALLSYRPTVCKRLANLIFFLGELD